MWKLRKKRVADFSRKYRFHAKRFRNAGNANVRSLKHFAAKTGVLQHCCETPNKFFQSQCCCIHCLKSQWSPELAVAISCVLANIAAFVVQPGSDFRHLIRTKQSEAEAEGIISRVPFNVTCPCEGSASQTYVALRPERRIEYGFYIVTQRFVWFDQCSRSRF